MSVAREKSKCPLCLEIINTGAKRCPHCHAELSPAGARGWFSRYNNFRVGFLTGTCFALVLITLLYGHFFWE